MMIDDTALTLNSDCYCWPIERGKIVDKIVDQGAATDMAALLSERPHYFASTSVFLSPSILTAMTDQIRAIEDVIKLPGYIEAVKSRSSFTEILSGQSKTKGVFMGYDFHITEKGPRLIEINSNAGGAFIVDMLEQSVRTSAGDFAKRVLKMFETEWASAGRSDRLKSIAIVDSKPEEQYHYPDMCLAKSLLEKQGLDVVIADPEELSITDGQLYYNAVPIDLVYNRLTDFNLTEFSNLIIRRAYEENATVVTPAPHHHALYADKRNLILLSDQDRLAKFGVSRGQRKILQAIPATAAVTNDKAEMMWEKRRHLFFKPQAGFGSRGAFRGAKLTKKVWGEILSGGYIAQEMVAPPIRAVTVNGEKTALKFDVRIYTYDGQPLLLAARVYQGQTTNLRTAGGGLAL
jgi:hypothetical protein